MAEYVERFALRDALYDADAITMRGVKIINQFPTAADTATVRWIPVTERLPRNYTPVLAYIPSLARTMQQTVHECHIGADGEWHSSTAPAYREGVTHWMPMPEQPEAEAALEGGEDHA